MRSLRWLLLLAESVLLYAVALWHLKQGFWAPASQAVTSTTRRRVGLQAPMLQ